MNIEGLDYNTQRTKLRMCEYGREVQQMVDHCMTLPTREMRLACAKTIIATMKRMTHNQQNNNDRMHTLWDHLALMSDFKLDIDYPIEITTAEKIASKPDRVEYPNTYIPVRHYGKELFCLFNKLKEMQPGAERDALTKMTANQMRRCLLLWGQGNGSKDKVANDLAKFTDGKIQIDINKFQFDNIDVRSVRQENSGNSKKKKKK